MIDSKELRIGNYLLDTRNGDIHEVSGNTIHCLEFDNSDILKPIPLTEEWLIKFGFERQYPDHPKGFSLLNIDEELSFSFGVSHILNLSKKQYGVILTFSEIKYVHQLQNLYFTLTGKELTHKKLIKT